ncbi:hypothetical protein A9995_12855 [Erythrobacter sp. QSSC1-22B]|uniref:hypothetical protein n=1 Tax=Erythrobacter sp. QSSC1-22B TaxID=1860125 RepID=UPI000805191D|nr:hypothetical protein [Erythrobacter sp. QSSC1-22B]OBX18357.1 hypothetical protein A9995_12855 [Erythrobacter sp. QSSC1-22B]
MISQKKINLAVLYKVYQICEARDQSPTHDQIRGAFNGFILSLRRVEVATEKLQNEGLLDSWGSYDTGHTYCSISGEGLDVVDRALRMPSSFIGRIAAQGDAWLNSDEAEKAILGKRSRLQGDDLANLADVVHPATSREASHAPVTINNNFAPSNFNEQSVESKQEVQNSPEPSATPQWISILIALLIGVAAIIATLYAGGKL